MKSIPDIIPDHAPPRPVLIIEAGGERLYLRFEENPAAKAFLENLSETTLDLSDRGDKKVGALTWELPESPVKTAVKPGDLVFCGEKKVELYNTEAEGEFTVIARAGGTVRFNALTAPGGATVKMFTEWSE